MPSRNELVRIAVLDPDRVIPFGEYCYRITRVSGMTIHTKPCPFWGRDKARDPQENGFCRHTGLNDWTDNTLLWEGIKECGEKIHPCG